MLVNEIMGSNLRMREAHRARRGRGPQLLRHHRGEQRLQGWTTFDQSLQRACIAGLIDEETALHYATHRNKLSRLLDEARKRQGVAEQSSAGLRLDDPKPAASGLRISA